MFLKPISSLTVFIRFAVGMQKIHNRLVKCSHEGVYFGGIHEATHIQPLTRIRAD